MKYYFWIILFCTLSGCHLRTANISEIKAKADALLDKIADGTAEEEFSTKYFPIEQTKTLMYDLKNNCDFKNRHGHFINEYFSADRSRVSLIYEYYLKCDSARFILTYNLVGKNELDGFRIEGIEKENPMVNDQVRRLKY
ncbi:hypothetical protein ACTJIJ_22650 [Niabella sp. 22666]|uniref:hypothetical protein n=1 Tax=Niabella sp. 22666 TaxID=3453954 RepID=UPI003F87D9A6